MQNHLIVVVGVLSLMSTAHANPINAFDDLSTPGLQQFNRGPSVCNEPDADYLVDNFEAWYKEVGPDKFSCWEGDLTLYAGDTREARQPSVTWPYKYDRYRGLICMKLDGNQLIQRNIFFYPPADPAWCAANGNPMVDSAVCGVNGNARIFEAQQTIAGCDGSLEGPFFVAGFPLDTRTTVEGDNVINYEVSLFGQQIQTQQTTLLNDTTRVRNAMGFIPFTTTPSYLSFYTETKVTPLSEAAVRAIYDQNLLDYNINNDGCVYGDPGPTDCETFFFDFFWP